MEISGLVGILSQYDLDTALRIAGTIKQRYHLEQTLLELSGSYLARGDSEKSLELLRKAEKMIDSPMKGVPKEFPHLQDTRRQVPAL
jgi:hypothetical protein